MISIIVALIVIGLLLYVVNLLPLDGTVKRIIHAVVIVFVVLWLLGAFGLLGTRFGWRY